MAGNLIVRAGRLSGVIDFGGLGLGDPAPDLCPAWYLFDAGTRNTWREAMAYDDATWRRARGWALAPAVSGIDYYAETWPASRRLAGASSRPCSRSSTADRQTVAMDPLESWTRGRSTSADGRPDRLTARAPDPGSSSSTMSA